MNKPILLACFMFVACCSKISAQKTAYTMPEVNKILKEIHLYIDVELDDSVKNITGLTSSGYLIPLTNYIDYNEIGKGNSVVLNDDELREFIIKSANSGKTASKIGKELITEYVRLKSVISSNKEKEDIFHVGGFFAGETELHQENDGKFNTLLEVNQLRLYFASHLNSTKKANRVSMFAEYNPIPEEVIHQIDEAIITKGSLKDTLLMPEIPGEHDEAIQFERLFINVKNVGGSKFNVTIGQFRNPFGIWSDYTSHRNFTATKNNTLVNGFALKKIELGIKADVQLNKNLEFEAAIVHGRYGRTAPLYRADFDNKKDLVAHLSYARNRLTAGASAYLSEFSLNKRTAYGIDLGYRFDKLLLSGEFVIQRNNEVNVTSPKVGLFINELSSTSAYLQFDYELSRNLHLYGMYDFWMLKADKQKVNNSAYKFFNGLKYSINPKTRWTILEVGLMSHKGFNEGNTHISTQLEINF